MQTAWKWRYGVNRWFVLLFVVLAIFVAILFPPVRPPILVATERLSEHPLFSLPLMGDFYLTNTITTLVVADFLIILLAWLVRQSLRKQELIPRGLAGAAEMLVEVLYNLTESTAGRWTKLIFPWFATFLIVVLLVNWMALIPGMEAFGNLEMAEHGGHAAVELLPGIQAVTDADGSYQVIPWFRGISTDLNFTIALALISVIATQVVGFQTQGWRYILRFFNVTTLFSRPGFGAMDFAVGLLELISEFSKILSFAFRLFGNMFAGMVLLFLMSSLVPVFAPALVMLFEFFIGAIQAFVFGMLTLVFMAQATQGHGENHEA